MPRKHIQLTEAIEEFLIARNADGLSLHTIARDKHALSILTNFLHNPDLDLITPLDLRNFMAYLRIDYKPTRPNGDTSPLSPASIDSWWGSVRAFFTWAEEELGLERPDRRMPRPRFRNPIVEPFSEDDIKALLEAAMHAKERKSKDRMGYRPRRPTALRDQAIILILLDTGLRVSELARLTVEDVDLESGEVRVQPYGSGLKTKPRSVYIGKVTKKALWRYMSQQEKNDSGDPVIKTYKNRPMNRDSIRHALDRIGKSAGVRDVHPHRFRHTFAIQFLRNGGDIFVLQRILGHSTLDMVKSYLAIADHDVLSVHRRASPADRWYL